MVGLIIRTEGLTAFLASLYFYNYFAGSWLLFIALFFAPDISLFGYLRDNKTGSVIYNSVHNYILAFVVIMSGIVMVNSNLTSIGLILSAHVGMDRFLGFGLKYPAGIKNTHIQKI